MHARISVITGGTDIDGGVKYLRDQAVQELRQQKGFQALTAAGDRATGTMTVLSQWESEADLQASESTADKVRADAVKIVGGQVRVERYEQLLMEVDTVPAPGAKLHIRHIRMDPSRIDDNAAFFRENVLPELRSTPGFQAVRQLINRSTGEGRVGTIWADQQSLDGSLARTEERRAKARDQGVEFVDDQTLEVLFAER